ncbi:hypothetical protein GGI43DRAFT_382881 [Trichoderma evansii]
MAKKKVKQAVGEEDGGIGSQPSAPIPATHQAAPSPSPSSRQKSGTADAAQSTGLAICRNKHWRYISSYHGPWLQMPYEILETIANINYNTPLPRPLDAASFFDLVKVRRLVDEATNLAVRAASDIASPTLTNVNGGFPSISSMISHGMGAPGHSGRLSRERKFKMREQASQKLARAYRLDEIVCSVATMQGASPLEDVGNLVLQRNSRDPDAKYVHFFHEKIPSRKMAESTSLEPLTEIVGDRPGEPEVLRTRATVKVFQNDLEGAVSDLTHALSISLFIHKSHQPKQEDTQVVDSQRTAARRRPHDVILPEKDQPSSLEAQLYFQRASVYLTLASDNAVSSMPTSSQANGKPAITNSGDGEAGAEISDPGQEISQKQSESRKMAKTFAKRAIKDYMSFLSNLHYSPNLPAKIAKEFNDRVSMVMHGIRSSRAIDTGSLTTSHTVYSLPDLFRSVPPTDIPPYPPQDLMKQSVQQPLDEAACEWVTYHPLLSDALHSLLLAHCLAQTSTKELQRHAYMVARLVRLSDGYPLFQANRSSARADWTELVHCAGNWLQLSSSWDNLCQPAPLPSYLEDPCKHHCLKHGSSHKTTPQSERSIAASAAAALVGGGTFDAADAAAEEEQRRKDLIREQAIADTLDDERVTDEASFRAAVKARERRAQQNEALFSDKSSNGAAATIKPGPGLSMNGSNGTNGMNGTYDTSHAKSTKITNGINGSNGSDSARNGYRAIKETDLEPLTSQRWSAEDGKEYTLTTERANAIARWVQEAPVVTGMTKRKKRTKKTDGSANGHSTKVNEAEKSIERLEI